MNKERTKWISICYALALCIISCQENSFTRISNLQNLYIDIIDRTEVCGANW